MKGLIRGLQIELGESTIDGIFGNGTATKFNTMFPNGLSESTDDSSQNVKNIIYILQGGFYCRGIDPETFNGFFGIQTTDAVKEFQTQAGITPDGIVTAKIMKPILTTDAFTLLSSGDSKIREIQQALNSKYSSYMDLIPTNGLSDRKTSKGLIVGLQKEINVTVDGIWGPGTLNACPTLQRGSTKKNLVYILQYALYINGFDPNGFDGGFGNGVVNAVKNFHNFVKLDSDGIVGKQTWASLLISYGDKNRTVTACDTSKKITHNTAKVLKNNGYQIVGRYLTGSNKGLTIEELQIIIVTDTTITDAEYGSLLIDKDVYSENVQAVDHLAETSITDKNASFKEKIHTLYNLAKEYAPALFVPQWNRLVLQYLRYPEYDGIEWTFLDGNIDKNFVEYVNSHSNGELSPNKIVVYDSIYDIYMDLSHWAASTEVHLQFANTPNLPVAYVYKDLAGWAGDLVYLAGQLQKQYEKNTSLYHYTSEQIYGLIGCNDDDYVINLGFNHYVSPAKDSGFNLTDLLQDADAFNLYDELLLTPIDEALISYFESGHTTRFHQFCDELRSILTIIGDPFTVFNMAARTYTMKSLTSLPIEQVFLEKFGDFNQELWGVRLAEAFGNKLTNLLNSETT